MPRRSWLSALDWGEFGFNFHLAASIISFSLLLAIYATLLAFRATHALDSRLFSIDRIDKVTQIIVGVSQTSIIILTAALSFTMEALASDAVLRRSKRVCAFPWSCRLHTRYLQDSLWQPFRITWPHGAVWGPRLRPSGLLAGWVWRFASESQLCSSSS